MGRALIRAISDTEGAVLAAAIEYDGSPLIGQDARKWMGDVDNPNSPILNDEFWADKYDVVGRRFKEWALT